VPVCYGCEYIAIRWLECACEMLIDTMSKKKHEGCGVTGLTLGICGLCVYCVVYWDPDGDAVSSCHGDRAYGNVCALRHHVYITRRLWEAQLELNYNNKIRL